MMEMIVVGYVCASVGVVGSTVSYVSPIPAAKRCVDEDLKLGDLNPIPWVFMFSHGFAWTMYSLLVKDWFVFFGSAPGLVVAVYLNLQAIKLQYYCQQQNEGQQLQKLETTSKEKSMLLLTAITSDKPTRSTSSSLPSRSSPSLCQSSGCNGVGDEHQDGSSGAPGCGNNNYTKKRKWKVQDEYRDEISLCSSISQGGGEIYDDDEDPEAGDHDSDYVNRHDYDDNNNDDYDDDYDHYNTNSNAPHRVHDICDVAGDTTATSIDTVLVSGSGSNHTSCGLDEEMPSVVPISPSSTLQVPCGSAGRDSEPQRPSLEVKHDDESADDGGSKLVTFAFASKSPAKKTSSLKQLMEQVQQQQQQQQQQQGSVSLEQHTVDIAETITTTRNILQAPFILMTNILKKIRGRNSQPRRRSTRRSSTSTRQRNSQRTSIATSRPSSGLSSSTSSSSASPTSLSQEGMLMRVVLFWLFIVTGISFIDYDPEHRNFFIGILANMSMVFFYAAPLSTIATVLRTRSSSTIYLPSVLTATLNNTMWFTYGLFIMDPFLLLPCGSSLLLSIIECVLWFMF